MRQAMRRIPALLLAGGALLAGRLLDGVVVPRSAHAGRVARVAHVAVATIAPLADFVSLVAGPDWSVRTVVPPGTSPHVFEPTPRHVREVADASLLVTVGFGYDDWARRLVSASASSARIHVAGSGIGPLPPPSDGEVDPHWWLSPELAARSLAPLAETLADLDPAGAGGYRERAAKAAALFLQLDAHIARELASVRGRGFLSAHPAWGYFGNRYGLHEIGSLEPVPGREPSPVELKGLIDLARKERVSTLFTEPQFPTGAARVIAADAGLRVMMVDPIGGVPGRQSYLELMRFNADVFVRGLAPLPRSGA